MKFNNVLVVAAHPDDEVLGVGGTIPLIKKLGGKVTVLIVTDGSTVQYEADKAILKRKNTETEDANHIMGSNEVIQWDFPDMQLDRIEHYKLNRAFQAIIEERHFDTVFVHHSGDINLDHRLIYESVLVAARPVPGQVVKQVFSYYVNSSTEWGGRSSERLFCPNFFVDITSTIDIKLRAMEAYPDELREYPHPRSVKALRDQAAFYGSHVGCEYAEPFRLILFHGSL